MKTQFSRSVRHSVVPFALALLFGAGPALAEGGREATQTFFEGREASLRRDDGWLSLVGLFRLDEGTPAIGSAEDATLRVPDRHPATAGHFDLDSRPVRFVAADGVRARVGDTLITDVAMQPDVTGDPTIVEIGSLLFYVIERNDQLYLRVKDREAALLESFHGIERWDYDPALRVQAQWVRHDEPHEFHVPDVLGGGETMTCEGAVEFDVDGATYRLEPTWRGDDRWSFIYGDATNGVESYGGGRFLYFDAPDEDGVIDLDFNQSYNPPCVFTPYATCPLPPRSNVLKVAIPAGEKMWGEPH